MSSGSSAGLVTKFSEVSGAGRVVYFVQQEIQGDATWQGLPNQMCLCFPSIVLIQSVLVGHCYYWPARCSTRSSRRHTSSRKPRSHRSALGCLIFNYFLTTRLLLLLLLSPHKGSAELIMTINCQKQEKPRQRTQILAEQAPRPWLLYFYLNTIPSQRKDYD